MEGETSSVHGKLVTRLRCPQFTHVSVTVDKRRELWHGYMLPGNRMRYRINFPSLKNSEFEATFRFLLWEMQESDEWKSDQMYSQRRLRRFYSCLLRLDRIFTEFKKKGRVASYPTHIIALDAQ